MISAKLLPAFRPQEIKHHAFRYCRWRFNLVTLVKTIAYLSTALACATLPAFALANSGASVSSVGERLANDAHHAPKGYLSICTYGSSCAVTKPSLVAFGSHGDYAYRVINGSFLCSERTFNRAPSSPSAANCSVATTKASAPAAPKTLAADLSTGDYAIISRHSGKALELDAKGTFHQTPYIGKPSQHFSLVKREDGYFTIANAAGQSLEVEDWSTSDGAKIASTTPSESLNQQWSIEDADAGYLSIASRFSGKALDLFGMNTHNNAQVRLWTYWGGKNQQWQLIRLSDEGTAEISF